MGEAIIEIGLVAIALEDAFVFRAEPVAYMPMFATRLPVENDFAGETAINPEIASGAALRNGLVEVTNVGLVGPDIMTFEHVPFHEFDKQATLISDFRSGVAHGVGADINAVTLLVEHMLAVERKMIDKFISEYLGEQSRAEEAAFDDRGLGGFNNRRAERMINRNEFHPQDAIKIEITGFFFELNLFLKAASSIGFGISLDDFRNDLFGPDRQIFGKSIFANAARALLFLGFFAGGDFHRLFRFGRVRIFGLLPGEEVGVIELFALATEELTFEPGNLLLEDRDSIL